MLPYLQDGNPESWDTYPGEIRSEIKCLIGNLLPEDKVFRLVNTDNIYKCNVATVVYVVELVFKLAFKMAENIGKEENAGYLDFLQLITSIFFFFCIVVKILLPKGHLNTRVLLTELIFQHH